MSIIASVAQDRGINVLQHDHVVWLGDLNYRIGVHQTVETVRKCIT